MWRGKLGAIFRCVTGTIVLAIAAWGQQPAARAPAPQRYFRISGTVVDAQSGQLLRDAEVTIGSAQEPGAGRSVITGDDGGFQFDGLLPRKYWLAAQKRGFARQNFNQHEQYSTAIAVGQDLQSEGLIFRLHRDAALSGTITDEANEPIRDAQVMLFHSGLENGERRTHPRGQVSSDDQGRYHFSHLPPGAYFVAVSARPWYAQNQQFVRSGFSGQDRSGSSVEVRDSAGANQLTPAEEKRSPLDVAYPITFYAGTTEASAATPITLQEGDRAIADVGLTAMPALHLRLNGVTQESASGYGVTLVQHLFDGGSIQVPVQTAAFDGQFEITGAPPGEYEVNVQSYGKNRTSWAQTLNLAEHAEINAGEAFASPTISGMVQLDGLPAPQGAFVRLWNKATGEGLGAQVRANGEFQVQQAVVKPGSYEVGVVNVLGVVVSKVSASGAKVVGQRVEITGGTIRLTVSLSKRSGRVDGVALRNGKPMAGAMVVLVPNDIEHNEELFRRDQSDSDGTFSLFSVVPGRYTVVAIAEGWGLEWLNPSVLKPFLKNAESVEVKGSGRQQIKVKVQ